MDVFYTIVMYFKIEWRIVMLSRPLKIKLRNLHMPVIFLKTAKNNDI